MKSLARILSFVLVLMLILSLGTPACAVSAQYSSTQAFLNVLDENDVIYTTHGINKNKNEHISIDYEGDHKDDIEVDVFFNKDLDSASFYVWDIIQYKDKDLADLLAALNKLNLDYRYVKFYADASDNTVTAQIDVIFRDDDIGEICDDALYYIVRITDEGYPELKPFAS